MHRQVLAFELDERESEGSKPKWQVQHVELEYSCLKLEKPKNRNKAGFRIG